MQKGASSPFFARRHKRASFCFGDHGIGGLECQFSRFLLIDSALSFLHPFDLTSNKAKSLPKLVKKTIFKSKSALTQNRRGK